MPDLATDWSWDEDKTQPTLRLRQGVKWHDGKPFTAKDVECTWNLLTGKSSDKLRVNPRKAWYHNLEEVTRNLDYWKKDLPYLDGIDYVIMKNVSTGVLAFVAGSVDFTSPYLLQVPVVRDVRAKRHRRF